MEEEDKYKKLELFTVEKVNKKIYTELDELDFNPESKYQIFEIIFKVLDVINHYEWNWIKKWEYLKSYLAQLEPSFQKLIIHYSIQIAKDRLNIEDPDIKILISNLTNLKTDKNKKVNKKLLKANEIVGRDTKKFIEGFCRVRGWLMKDSEIIDNFVKDNYDEIIKRVYPERIVESNSDLIKKVLDYLLNSIKHDIELDGGYRYLWKQEKPLKETDSQPFLKILFNKYCENSGVFIARENKSANGQVDFTLAQNGYNICIEVKNAHHKDILKSIHTQLPKYMEGQKTEFGIYLVLWFKSDNGFPFPEKYSNIDELENALNQIKPKGVELVIINCSKPISPSKLT